MAHFYPTEISARVNDRIKGYMICSIDRKNNVLLCACASVTD